MKYPKKLLAVLAAFCLAGAGAAWSANTKAPDKQTKPAMETKQAASKEKTHQLTGTVSSFTDTSLVLSHGPKLRKRETTFMMNPESKKEGTLENGAKVTVFYVAEGKDKVVKRLQVHEMKASAETKPATKAKAAKKT